MIATTIIGAFNVSVGYEWFDASRLPVVEGPKIYDSLQWGGEGGERGAGLDL